MIRFCNILRFRSPILFKGITKNEEKTPQLTSNVTFNSIYITFYTLTEVQKGPYYRTGHNYSHMNGELPAHNLELFKYTRVAYIYLHLFILADAFIESDLQLLFISEVACLWSN